MLLACSGIIPLTSLATKSIDISNEDAIKTIIVSNGIIAKMILKAIFDGNIFISFFDNILNNFLKYDFIFFDISNSLF